MVSIIHEAVTDTTLNTEALHFNDFQGQTPQTVNIHIIALFTYVRNMI